MALGFHTETRKFATSRFSAGCGALSLVLLVLPACQSSATYSDVSGLNRGQQEFSVASAQCELYARNLAAQRNATAARAGVYTETGALLTELAVRKDYNTCLRAQGFEPNQ